MGRIHINPSLEFLFKREYSFYYGAAVLFSLENALKGAEIPIENIRGEGTDDWFACYADRGTLKKVKKWAFALFRNDKALKKEIKKFHASGKRFVEISRKIAVSSRISIFDLEAIYTEFFDELILYLHYLWTTWFIGEFISEYTLMQLKKKYSAKKANEILTQCKPSQKASVHTISDFFAKEKKLSLRIAFMEKHFPWISHHDPFAEPMSRKEIKEYASSYKAQAQGKLTHKKIKSKILSQYEEILFIKDKRDEYRREAFYQAHSLMKELAKRLHISLTDLPHVLPDELHDRDMKKKIEMRKHGYIAHLSQGFLTIHSGKGIDAEFLQSSSRQGVIFVRGIIGNSGKSKGIVQKIIMKKDVSLFKKGRILVASTTNPEHFPAMQKAIAFVTDEGGITSHAAIVAREMKKPCIVGTKIATKVFQDGDVIEVDAEKGIVKKLI